MYAKVGFVLVITFLCSCTSSCGRAGPSFTTSHGLQVYQSEETKEYQSKESIELWTETTIDFWLKKLIVFEDQNRVNVERLEILENMNKTVVVFYDLQFVTVDKQKYYGLYYPPKFIIVAALPYKNIKPTFIHELSHQILTETFHMRADDEGAYQHVIFKSVNLVEIQQEN